LKEFTVVARDRIGLLADLAELLGRNGVNIEYISAEARNRTAVIRLVPKPAEKAKRILGKAGYKLVDSNILVVRLPNKPGQLAELTRVLAGKGVDVERVYLIGQEGQDTFIGIEAKNYFAAKNALKNFSGA
jgi:hypothetical protein